MKELVKSVMLTNLVISQWSARKYDKIASKKIEADNNAHNAGKFNKLLIAESELKAIQAAGSAARSYLYTYTLPWGDNGDRVLPATMYFDFVNSLRSYQKNFDDAVTKFLHNFPSLKEEAKVRLNGLFNEADYPPLDVLSTKFNMRVTFMPIADQDDFRLDINATEVAILKTQIEAEVKTRLQATSLDIWKRIHEAVSNIVDRLGDEKAIFRDSLIENLHQLVNLLPKLNFMADKDITTIAGDLRMLIVAPENLRTDSRLRSEKASQAKAILDKVDSFLG